MSETITPGTTEDQSDGTRLVRFVLDLPHPVISVWAAVATPEGLPTWLCAAELLEPRIGGAVVLRQLTADAEGRRTAAEGRVTAWDMERVAEYTVGVHGRIRFHLEPHGDGTDRTVLRFTNQLRCDDEALLDRLACWHDHVERLAAALDGHPTTDWSTWTADHRRRLRQDYARR
ncbi:SRPBCC domain-containing protein [Streptomyces sp. C10-9-1]|uniref:SRPBCC domain-containing protein n=1 Tax=Streptomyces sp. C10-9-1 TaxID=1859285 RepID=UPI002112B0F2|nr:SRPBCC domain-containing protein [Streptomyces sp. C10-9-1]MCQ6556558.1 SRPBCC domain-containing protein [Streptomyces sp. C10-9-1]